MVRIYFDKQIFSYLFDPKEEKYRLLIEKIYTNKNNLLFYYSDAHLQDLSKDTTDIKIQELDFMKGIVDDNYISYDAQRKNPICFIRYPDDAFNEYKDIENMDFYEDIDLSSLDEEHRSLLENVADIFILSEKGELDNTWFLTRETIKDGAKYDDATLVNVIRSTMQELISNVNTYKTLRRVVFEEYNKGRLKSKDGDVSFNDTMKNTSIGLSYIEFVLQCLKQVGIKKYSDYDFHTLAYCTLDMLGISNDKGSTVKFGNMITDGKHSYYASLCDCFVSHDKRCVNKTRILYRLLGIKTKVYHIDDFIQAFDNSIQWSNKCLGCSLNAIMNDYTNGDTLRVDERDDVKVTDIKTTSEYFGFFDYMRESVMNGSKFIILNKATNHTQNFITFNELELITNKLTTLIGIDDNGRSTFDKAEIENVNNINYWEGRKWTFTDCTIHLNTMKYPYGISLVILLKKE